MDRSLVYKSYPLGRINTQVIYRFVLSQVECTLVNALLKNCKQNTSSLSPLAGRTVTFSVLSYLSFL